MPSKRQWAAVVILCTLLAAGTVPSFAADALVLAGGTCIDRAAVATPDCVMVIREERIERAGPRGSTPLPPHATIIDTRGRWIVPGFVDNHVHLGRVNADPDVWIRAGVTTLVENGSSIVPAELGRRYAAGPRVDACGPIITRTGGYPAFREDDAPALQVSGPADAARRTRELIEKLSPACIKVAVERGFESDLDESGWAALNRAELEAVYRQARSRRLNVHAHVTQQQEFDLAVAIGAAVIAHSPIAPLPDASLRRAARKNVVMVSTAALWGEGVFRASAIENLIRYVRMGGPIAIGSDYPNWRTPGLPVAELKLLRQAGLSLPQILTALTRNTGGAEPRDADLVILRRNPLLSLDALQDVDAVILRGVVAYRR